jgi:DNA-binding FrmR family transcriptional regulator
VALVGGTIPPNPMPGYQLTRDDHLKRLRRIEGQVRGLQSMIESDKYCIDVLTQIASVTKALQSVGLGLLDEHIRHCVREAAEADEREGDAKVEEAVAAVARLLKS